MTNRRVLRVTSQGSWPKAEAEFHSQLTHAASRLVETLGLRWIALRTEVDGLIDRAGARVAFEVDEVGPGHQGRSVLVRGTLERIDPETAEFNVRFDSEPWLPDREAWLVIEPFTITGREVLPGEREWAFSVSAYL